MKTPSVQLVCDPHPLLDLKAFQATLGTPLGRFPHPDWLADLLTLRAQAPVSSDDAVKTAVRELLRHGGYKPSGRGKPASEYLRQAEAGERLQPINPVVDACNAVSLHSGLPVSVIDLDRATLPLRVGIAAEGASYVFNQAGQEIRLTGLLCLHDADGPCANAVKDAQRTKTHDDTVRTLSLIWGTRTCPGQAERAVDWYRTLLERMGARTHPVRVIAG